MTWFAIKITSEGKAGVLKTNLFIILVIILTVIGVSLHITKSASIPWVSIDLHRGDYTPDKTINISMVNHEFKLPEEKLTATVGKLVLFDVETKDLTYASSYSIVFDTFMGMAGLKGMLRRTIYYEGEYNIYMILAGIAGSLLLIAFLLFLYNVLMTVGLKGLIGIYQAAKLKTEALLPEEAK